MYMEIADPDPDPELTRFLQKGCGCRRFKGQPCFQQFTRAHYEAVRADCAALSSNELDLVLMGQIMALLSNSSLTQTSAIRQRANMAFYHGGIQICGRTFWKLHGIGLY